jgi:epoxyqueuosine reductase
MDKDELKLALKTDAASLGFSLFSVTVPDPPANFGIFHDWLQRGFHAGMTYLERKDTLQKRSNPRLLMPDCRSVICLGYPYRLIQPDPDQVFKVASYTQLEDYHNLFPRLHAKLQEIIAECAGGSGQCKVFTDSAPILERELASRAGLGWIGKNSCLIHPNQGSSFLLAEIFTSLELGLDEPFTEDRCGTCTRCIEACPADCILPGRVIDANRCISYQTIENKGIVPEEFRHVIGNRIFGCDICQEVCPWNSSILETKPCSEIHSLTIDFQLLIALLGMDDSYFRHRFEGSPLLRTGRVGLIRNILIGIGNSSDRAYLPFLKDKASCFEDPITQEYTEWAIKILG